MIAGVVVFVENIENEELFEELEALVGYYKVVRGEEFAVVYQKGRDLDVIGTVDRAGKRAFRLLTERSLTSKQLAEMEGKAQNAAANQLNRLYKAGLIYRRQVVDSDGRSYVYYLR
jgi:DNA-binding transcriptional ArsR family regulator